MIFVQAVRRIKPDFEYLIKGFIENYLNIILANLLVFALVVLGLFALIIPGIIIACRLAFVPYIIMDKKLDPIEAVELSWKLTKGSWMADIFNGFRINIHRHLRAYIINNRDLPRNNVDIQLIRIPL